MNVRTGFVWTLFLVLIAFLASATSVSAQEKRRRRGGPVPRRRIK